MILFPGCSAYVAEIAPRSKQGQYMGFYTMAFSVAFTVGPWLGLALVGAAVWLVPLVGYAVAFVVLAVAMHCVRKTESHRE